MRLNNLQLLDKDGLYDLLIDDGMITAIQPSGERTLNGHNFAGTPGADDALGSDGAPGFHGTPGSDDALDLEGALAFPGLINSHDHLDFNLFPRLGNRTYRSYTEWGPDIHANNTTAIQSILRIPQALRLRWGIYKNLLNGFTTVVNHGEHLPTGNAPITVFQDCYCLHSVGFEPNWKWKLNHPAKRGQPFTLHVGEGTDTAATREIDELLRWNIFRRPLIGIHGVAMTARQAPAFRALVWCPASNYFLLDKTAAIDSLHSITPILFGTDSTLTSGWNAWEQIRQARDLRLVSDIGLLAMLTSNPAAAWGLNDRGTIAAGKRADLVIARPKSVPQIAGQRSDTIAMDAFFSLGPEDFQLVLHEGQIRLFDRSLLGPITENQLTAADFQPSATHGKYVIGDLPALMQEINRFCPDVEFHGMTG